MRNTLVYISSCAFTAEGTPDTFLLQELPWLCGHFERVLVCSGRGIAEISKDRPAKIHPEKPACGELRAFVSAWFQKQLWSEIRRLKADKKKTAPNLLKLFLFTVRGRKLFYWIQSSIQQDEQVTAYAYWMSYDGYAAALCKQKNRNIRAIARGHAFDIDIQRNPMNPYLMKRFMAEQLDCIYPISETAKEHISAYTDVPQQKLRVVGVGSAGEKAETYQQAPRFMDGILHVISCSAMVEIKQLPLLIDTLAKWKHSKLHWIHIGGGTDEAMVRSYAAKMLGECQEITYTLAGTLPPEQVRALYATKPFDVFINTSRNEGTPVAIMEALHAGIPVVAPAVGGIPELVDESVGCLYPQGGDTDDILRALTNIHQKTTEESDRMSRTAQARWNERCLLNNLLPKLFPEEAKKGAQQ